MITGLAKIGMALRSQAWQESGTHGLTPTQGQILVLLKNHKQPMRLSEITEGLAVKPPTASDAVAVLVDKGLVKKARSPEDKRVIALSLTEKGEADASNVASWPDFLVTAIDQLDEEEQRIFYRGLIKMIKVLADRGQIPLARMCVNCQYFRPNVHSDSVKPHHCALIDAPLGDRSLRVDCPEHLEADKEIVARNWSSYTCT